MELVAPELTEEVRRFLFTGATANSGDDLLTDIMICSSSGSERGHLKKHPKNASPPYVDPDNPFGSKDCSPSGKVLKHPIRAFHANHEAERDLDRYVDPETPLKSRANSNSDDSCDLRYESHGKFEDKIKEYNKIRRSSSSFKSSDSDLVPGFDSIVARDLEAEVFVDRIKNFSFNIIQQFSSWKGNLNKTHTSIIDELTTENDRKTCELQTALETTTKNCQVLVYNSSQQRKLKENIAEYHQKKITNFKNRFNAFRIFMKWKTQTSLIKDQRNRCLQDLKKQFEERKLRNGFFSWYRKCAISKQARLNETWEKRIKSITEAISKEYETQLIEVRDELVASRNEISLLQKREKQIRVQMKSAVLRGVSRLNEETMSLFSTRDP